MTKKTGESMGLSENLIVAPAQPETSAPPAPPQDDLGLSIDMLDVDRLREWARLLLVHGADISHWASVPHVAGKMQTLATHIEHAVREVGMLRQHIEGLERQLQWQLIETAPLDGRSVLLWWPYWCALRPIVGWWQVNGGWQANELALEGQSHPPTHWIPLPAPPAAPTKEK